MNIEHESDRALICACWEPPGRCRRCDFARRRAFRHPPVDPFQQHRQLRRTDDAGPVLRLRPHEPAALQPLGEQAQSLTVPKERLDEIAAPAAKDEELTAERIALQFLLDDARQTVKTLAHVGRASRKPHARTLDRRQMRASHALSARMTRDSPSSSTSPLTRSTQPSGKAISTSPGGFPRGGAPVGTIVGTITGTN